MRIYIFLDIFSIYWVVKNYSNPKRYYGANYGLIFCSIYPSYREYHDYKNKLHLDKYGLVYNKTRQSLGIPIIPADWHATLYNRSAEWKGKKGALGHEEKDIDIDSLYKISYERDEYNLKDIHDTSRTISIVFKYARGKSSDSVFYWYHLKDTTLTISRHQADSIFDAAKIRKDY